MTRSTLARALVAAGAILALTPGAPRAQPAAEAVTAFTNVTVVDVRTGRLVPDSSILVRGNRIVTVDGSARMKAG